MAVRTIKIAAPGENDARQGLWKINQGIFLKSADVHGHTALKNRSGVLDKKHTEILTAETHGVDSGVKISV